MRTAVPRTRERDTITTNDCRRQRRISGPEAGAEYDDVGIASRARLRLNTTRIDRRDRISHQRDIRLAQRRVVVVRKQQTFAPDSVVRKELRPHPGVGDFRFKQPSRAPLGNLRCLTIAEWQMQRFVLQIQRGTRDALRDRKRAVKRFPPRRHQHVVARQHPGRRALEHIEMRHLRLNLRHELDRRCTGPNHSNSFRSEVDGMVPSSRVEHLPRKRFKSRDGRHDRIAQRATSLHDNLRAPGIALGCHGPALRDVIPFGAGHILREREMPIDIVRR